MSPTTVSSTTEDSTIICRTSTDFHFLIPVTTRIELIHFPRSLIAAYDMGAPPTLLKLIYDELTPTLRPIDRQGEEITGRNWTTRLGEHKCVPSPQFHPSIFFSDAMTDYE
jgi:hypothetical protein